MYTFDKNVRHFIKEITTINEIFALPNTMKAVHLLTEEMNVAKGFARHGGEDYFIHPIAVAQTLLDYQIVARRLRVNKVKEADQILATALLHDILEDVEWVTKEYLETEFSKEIAQSIDNVSKRDDELTFDYLERVSSENVSALVKTADRLNNVSTLSQSSDRHREKQYFETITYYLPLIKTLRKQYFEDAAFYWQSASIIVSILNEIGRGLEQPAIKL